MNRHQKCVIAERYSILLNIDRYKGMVLYLSICFLILMTDICSNEQNLLSNSKLYELQKDIKLDWFSSL